MANDAMISEQKTRVVWEAKMLAFSRFEVMSLGFEGFVFGSGSLSMQAFWTIVTEDGLKISSVLPSPMGSSFLGLKWYSMAALLWTSLIEICFSRGGAFSSLGLETSAKQTDLKVQFRVILVSI